MPRNNSKNAFTFIELLIVVTIIGILVGVSVPRLRKTADNFRLDNFIKDTYYLCRYLQAASVSEGRIYCLNVIPAEKIISVTYRDAEGAFTQAQGKLAKSRKVPEGVSVVSPKDTTGVYFYPDASVSEAAITFENNHNYKTSLITKGATGAIKIE